MFLEYVWLASMDRKGCLSSALTCSCANSLTVQQCHFINTDEASHDKRMALWFEYEEAEMVY